MENQQPERELKRYEVDSVEVINNSVSSEIKKLEKSKILFLYEPEKEEIEVTEFTEEQMLFVISVKQTE